MFSFPKKIASVLCCTLLFSGCAREPRAPQTLRLVAPSDVSSLDPAFAFDTGSMPYVRVLYRGLVDYGDGTDFVNALASTRSVSRDGLTYSFELRRDARFHFDLNGQSPGRRVVAEDVRYGIERILDPSVASDGFSFYQGIAGATQWGLQRKKWQDELSKSSTSDARKKQLRAQIASHHVPGIAVRGDEISFRLAQRDSTFTNRLALPFASAMPREWVEKIEGEKLSMKDHPNGCGPFQMATWTHDSFLRLEKNADYYDRALPKCNAVELRFGGDETLSLMRFETGDVDLLPSLEDTPVPDFLRLKRDPKWSRLMLHAPMMDVRYLCMNTEMKPFDDLRVRRAFNYAIDKKHLQALTAERTIVARGVLPPGLPSYNPNLKDYEYSPTKARALLKAAGLEKGFRVELWYGGASVEWYDRAAQAIKQNLRAVGVEVTLRNVTYAEVKTAAGKRRNLKFSLLGWVQDYPDASNYFEPLLASASRRKSGSSNRSFYSNPRVDAMLQEAATSLDQKKRVALYRAVEKQVVRDAPLVPMLHTERYTIHQPWISGFTLHPMWSMRMEYIGVNQ